MYFDDEIGFFLINIGFFEYVDFYYCESIYFGLRFLYVWLRVLVVGLNELMILMYDLVGKGKFIFFIGIGGKKGWVEVVGMVKGLLGVEVVVYSIGWREDY